MHTGAGVAHHERPSCASAAAAGPAQCRCLGAAGPARIAAAPNGLGYYSDSEGPAQVAAAPSVLVRCSFHARPSQGAAALMGQGLC
eukprot:scaffold227309_cov18-Tisochrysis_lutea.AAC.1